MDPELLRLAVVAGILATSTGAGVWWKARDGRVRVPVTSTSAGPGPRLGELGLADAHDGPQAVLFGSATCSPCETVKQQLRSIEGQDPSFRWSYVDAAERLDLADEHRVRRVPTLVVFDADGNVRARTSGVPSIDELRAAIPSPRQPAA